MAMIPELAVTRDVPRLIPSDEQLARAREAFGFDLPASYVQFVRRYGYGLSVNLYLIYIPKAGGDDLVGRSRFLAERLRDAVKHGYARFTPDGSRELVERLVPFGYSENGETLAWDPTMRTTSEELAVFLIGGGGRGVYRAGDDLGEFLRRTLSVDRGGIGGRAASMLQPTFEPHSEDSEDE